MPAALNVQVHVPLVLPYSIIPSPLSSPPPQLPNHRSSVNLSLFILSISAHPSWPSLSDYSNYKSQTMPFLTQFTSCHIWGIQRVTDQPPVGLKTYYLENPAIYNTDHGFSDLWWAHPHYWQAHHMSKKLIYIIGIRLSEITGFRTYGGLSAIWWTHHP